MRFVTKCKIDSEIIADDGNPAGTMTGEFHGDTLRIESMKIKLEYLSANLLGQSFFEMTDTALARGAKRIVWDYSEPAGKDYTDAKNDPYYLAVLPFMIFRPKLKLNRYLKGGEYYLNLSEIPEGMWHDKHYPAERLEALGVKFLPVESLPEFYGQFEELLRADKDAEGLSPLGREYNPETSRIIVMNGELAGWCLSKEISDDVARISPVYIAKKFRTMRAGIMIETHVMNILKKNYSGIRLIYNKESDAHLIRIYSSYFGKAFTETARIFSIEVYVKD